MEADLAERLRRTLKARVRKSVGSIPTVCIYFFFCARTGNKTPTKSEPFSLGFNNPRIAQLAERETVDGYN